MGELIDLAKDNIPWVGTLLIFLSIFFEFSKIKINPLSWAFRKLSEKATEDVRKENKVIHQENLDINKRLDDVVYVKSRHYEEICQWRNDINDIVKGLDAVNTKVAETINNINSKLDEMYESQDENEMNRLRWEILSFADDLKSGHKHSCDSFHHVMEVNDKYHRIIAKRGFSNGVIDAEMEYIKNVYKKLLENNDFS